MMIIMKSKYVYVFDIDGVLLDVNERFRIAQNSDNFWRTFFSEELLELDRPRKIGIEILRDRAQSGLISIITGRPENLRRATINQLKELNIYRLIWRIIMRKRNDKRKSYIVKCEALESLINEGYIVMEVHDDDVEVLIHIRRIFPDIKLFLHEGESVIEFRY